MRCFVDMDMTVEAKIGDRVAVMIDDYGVKWEQPAVANRRRCGMRLMN